MMMEPDEIIEFARRMEQKIDALVERFDAREKVLEMIADASAVVADEAASARDDRVRNAAANQEAHRATAQIVDELRRDTDRLVGALNGQSMNLAAANATVGVLQETNRGLWRLILLGSGVVVFLIVSLLWLYADSNGQDAGRAFDAAGRATHSLVNPSPDVQTSGNGATTPASGHPQ